MLWGLFGWKVAVIYIASGIVIAIAGGLAIGRMKLEKEVEDYIYKLQTGNKIIEKLNWKDRIQYSSGYVLEIISKIWPYVVIGIAIGAVMHGYAPDGLLSKIAGPSNWFAVPVAVLIGVPLYSNVAGVIPIIKVLMDKGMAIGTALSLPDAIILRKVLKPRLLVIYFSVVAFGIMLTGYFFNWILK